MRKRPWRQACETMLRESSEADSIRAWGTHREVEGHPKAIFNYRFEHTLAAVKIARWLAARTGADLEIVECAAWLHDCAKHLNDPKGKDHHAQEASRLVEDILKHTDFPVEKIPAVRHAIEHHVGLRLEHRLEPLETACLWDADKLSKIGAASLVHFGCISGAFQPIDTASILDRGRHWLSMAHGIVSSFNTEAARIEGARRLRFIQLHYHQLSREWDDPMEESEP